MSSFQDCSFPNCLESREVRREKSPPTWKKLFTEKLRKRKRKEEKKMRASVRDSKEGEGEGGR